MHSKLPTLPVMAYHSMVYHLQPSSYIIGLCVCHPPISFL